MKKSEEDEIAEIEKAGYRCNRTWRDILPMLWFPVIFFIGVVKIFIDMFMYVVGFLKNCIYALIKLPWQEEKRKQ